MNGGPPGFHNAPVSRAVAVAVGLFSLIISVRGLSKPLGLTYEDIFEKVQAWRLITSLFAFSSSPELVFGLCLLYYFRVFERQMSSNKFAVFVLFSTLVSLLIECISLGLLKGSSLNPLSSGPYGLIFAFFVSFFFDIPISSRFRLFQLHLTDKTFIYLAGLQLLFSSGYRSLLPGICGVFAGLIYRLNPLGIRRLKLPVVGTSILSRLSWLPNRISFQALPTTVDDEDTRYSGARQMEEVVVAEMQDPLESCVTSLVSMGFDQDSARQALILTQYDLNAATNILLETQSQ